MKFLHAADLHIDSQLKGLDALGHAPAERIRAATRDAVVLLIDTALRERVDFVVLAGDIFDGPWPDATTGAWTASQFRRLRDAEVPVFLIRGNHDAKSQIASTAPWPSNVFELSADKPETVVLDSLKTAVHGQSFARREAPDDLAGNYPPPVEGLFNIGLLHTSLAGDPLHDPYAPTSPAVLASKGYDYWALGHIHQRRIVQQRHPAIVYSGNTQARHINEPGEKGCYVVHVENGQVDKLEFHATDVVRWDHCVVEADENDDADALRDRLETQLEQMCDDLEDRLLAVRVTISGACRAHRNWTELARRDEWEQEIRHLDVCQNHVWIEKLQVQTRPVTDRNAIRDGDHLVGDLLRLIDSIRDDDDALLELSASLDPLTQRAALQLKNADVGWSSPDQLREWLEQAETALVSQLWESDS
jgi:DNA repair protein SbcD/Mre11